MRLDRTVLAIVSLTIMGQAHGIGRRHHWRRLQAKVESTSNTTVLEKRFANAKFSFYDAGESACGGTYTNEDFIVAINTMQYAGGALCFETITITVHGKTTTARIVDKCMGCPFAGLDFSRGLFEYFASESLGIIYGTWELGDNTTPSPTTTTSAIPKTTWSPPPAPSTTKSSRTSSSSSPTTSSTAPSSSASPPAATATPAHGVVVVDLELLYAQLGGLAVQAPNL